MCSYLFVATTPSARNPELHPATFSGDVMQFCYVILIDAWQKNNSDHRTCFSSLVIFIVLPTADKFHSVVLACLHMYIWLNVNWMRWTPYSHVNVLLEKGGGGGFLQLKMKFLNVFKRCCLPSNLYDRGLFLTFAYTKKKWAVHLCSFTWTSVCRGKSVLRWCFVQ